MFEVVIKKKALNGIKKMPLPVQQKIRFLLLDLERDGPVRPEWPNYSRLGNDRYHCHLSHKWVACWQCEKGTIIIEVYYAGSREDAPY